jgi:hypothetical protein
LSAHIPLQEWVGKVNISPPLDEIKKKQPFSADRYTLCWYKAIYSQATAKQMQNNQHQRTSWDMVGYKKTSWGSCFFIYSMI